MYIVSAEVGDPAYRLWSWLDWKAGKSGVAKASYPEMAEALPFSERSVQRYVQTLLSAGWLRLDRPGKGHGRAWYRVRNPARSHDSGDDPTDPTDPTDFDTRGRRDDSDGDPGTTAMAADEPVEASPVSPLLESVRNLGEECPPVTPREGTEPAPEAGTNVCSEPGCGAAANGETGSDGLPWCRSHEWF